MNEPIKPALKIPARRRSRVRSALPSNVIVLHQRIMPRHAELLARWLEAGRCMGLCDASVFSQEPTRKGNVPSRPSPDYVLVWVRENIDPAYIIRPEGLVWVVIDAVRQNRLASTGSFAAALHTIRPVLKLEVAA